MKKPSPAKIPKADQTPTDAEMSTYGISRVSMDDQYQYGNYRYNSLENAVAQAKREQDEATK